MRQSQPAYGLHLGARGERFKRFIASTLTSDNKRMLNPADMMLLTNNESMKLYTLAFTSSMVDTVNNYEWLEHMGDRTVNKFVNEYIHTRFPQLNNTNGVVIATVIVNNLISKKSLSKLAEQLGFANYLSISRAQMENGQKRVSALEDCFEAFVGATELILNTKYETGYGYSFLYHWLKVVFDTFYPNISLKYEDVIDPVTRLKETFDSSEYKNAVCIYKPSSTTEDQEFSGEVSIYLSVCRKKGTTAQDATRGHAIIRQLKYGQTRLQPNGNYFLASAKGEIEAEVNAKASIDALSFLSSLGIKKEVPYFYTLLAQTGSLVETETPVITEESVKERWENEMIVDGKMVSGFDINGMYRTKPSNRLRSYNSTLLGLYCRTRNVSGVKTCLKMNADVFLLDSDGSSVLDLLFVGDVNPELCEEIMHKLLKVAKSDESRKLKMQLDVYNLFYKQYDSKYFLKHLKDFEVIQY